VDEFCKEERPDDAILLFEKMEKKQKKVALLI